MLLITGGAFQGKLDYALEITGLDEGSVVDGEYCDYDEIYEARIIYRFHELIRRLLINDEDIPEYVEKLIKINPEAVIIVNEVGSGIIPIDPVDRRYRETVGRTSCLIAKSAKEVHRVICGMGVRIKHG